MTTSVNHRRYLIAAAILVLAAAISAAVLPGGGTGRVGLGPADALAQAAQTTAGVTSGVATSTMTVAGQAVDVVVRFDGDDVEATFDEVQPDGGTRERTIRAVDGAGFEKQADGSWAPLEGEAGNAVQAIRGDIADRALFDAVRNAADVTQDGDVYRARLSPEQLASIDNALLATGGAPPAEGAAVEVEAGTDGLIRRIAIDAGDVQRTVTYSELGQPQQITAP